MTDFASHSPEPQAAKAIAASQVMPSQEPFKNDTHNEALLYPSIQCKLSIGAVDDPSEHEADAMADKVMRMPEQNFIQRKCSQCEEEEKVQRKPLISFIQRKESSAGVTASDAISNQINASKGNGSSIDNTTQCFMQSRFGTDFSNVKIHTGSDSVQMNRELNAKAFTVGNDIYFNEGQYNPNSGEGKHLLAHELTHTLQQGGESENRISRKVPSGCERDTAWKPLTPEENTDANASWDKMIGKAVHTSSDTTFINNADEAVSRFRSTSSGNWLITELDKEFTGKGCGQAIIQLEFVVDTDVGGATDGYATSDRGDLFPCYQTGVYYVQIKYKPFDTHDSLNDGISDMANTIQHEIGHVWFVNVHGVRRGPDEYTTGHGDVDKDPSNIDPRFCEILYSMSDELDIITDEARRLAQKKDTYGTKPDYDSMPEPDFPSTSKPSTSFLGARLYLNAGYHLGGGDTDEGVVGIAGADLVLKELGNLGLGVRGVYLPSGNRLYGGAASLRASNSKSPFVFDIEAGVLSEVSPADITPVMDSVAGYGSIGLGSNIGSHFFWRVGGYLIFSDNSDPIGGVTGGVGFEL